ncbi:hypothetical protein [Synoicihabitans lomoniglobus]|uniref:Uncharacterized protein n=1 Tax=Synoicihabitans lomoniglobus TaxID=2909285 RepID=A0AAF0CSX2_9BACT|nr:hypothetical protein [Opitutaceae bacterium LMO-M01]WED67460.1 hypothetical protein PXH66_11425 [Opitutaceae bacterium LMO-M01]
MYGFLYRLGTWLLQKVGVAVLIAVVALVAMGIWLYARDQVDAETRREEFIERLEASRVEIVAAQATALQAVANLKSEVREQERRVAAANKIIANLRALESWWESLFGNAEQQAANVQQVQRMEALKQESAGKIAALTEQLQHAIGQSEDLSFQLTNIEKDLVGAAESESVVSHYVRNAWDQSKGYLLIALLVYFFGPTVVKLLAYYVLAPVLSRGKPIRFDTELVAMPHVRPSAVSTEVKLWSGEVLRVKEKFLQASDEHLSRKTRFLFDWAIPFTSVACGLTELVEMRNTKAGERSSLTLSNSDDPHTELSVIEVPEGASLILRPSFLVGVITHDEEKVEIRRRWTLFRWQAWVTLQFRFFEFVGPCRLVVAGSRGVRAEVLQSTSDKTQPARRTNQLATIGFTPSLDYLPVRAETFWGYYRNMNPLFDDLFAGQGMFVLQETANDPEKGGPARFWQAIWNSVLKVFGI